MAIKTEFRNATNSGMTLLKSHHYLTAIALVYLIGCTGNEKSSSVNLMNQTKTGQQAGEKLFAQHCNFCHNGTVPEAPKIDALSMLDKSSILKALQTGVMRNQASTLSQEDHLLLAEYISSGLETETSTTLGKCADNYLRSLSETAYVGDWGMGITNWRFQRDEHVHLNANNVDELTLDWVFAFPHASRARVQPTILGNTLFTASQHGTIYALDRSSGCIQWTFQADAEIRSAITFGYGKNGQVDRLYFSDFNAVVYAFDLGQRKLVWKTEVDDHPAATITGSLNVHKDRIYVPVSSTEVISAMDSTYPCCHFRGSVVALDALAGEVIWKTYTIDQESTQHGQYRSGTARFGPSGAPVWSRPTIDTMRNLLYVGTGENYSHPTTETSDAIIAIDLFGGAIKWVQQTIPKDAWNAACVIPNHPNCPEDTGPDADFGAPPILVHHTDGDLLLVGQKSGMVYALNPDKKGAIVWQQLVGRGGIMGGIHWGMACDGQTLYVPINDQGTYPLHKDKAPAPGIYAIDVQTGRLKWAKAEKNRCPNVEWSCGPGITAAITATSDLVLAGALDGMLKIYAAGNGQELWAFDTQQVFSSINKVEARGGTIDSDGPIMVGNQLFVTSGYAKFNELAGNVLLAFSVD